MMLQSTPRGLHLYNFKHSYLIFIIYTILYGFKVKILFNNATSLFAFLKNIYQLLLNIYQLTKINNWYRFIGIQEFLFDTHHHHHVVLVARISLTLSLHLSQSFIASGRSSGLHPISSHSCWMYVRAGRPAFARPYVGVHKST